MNRTINSACLALGLLIPMAVLTPADATGSPKPKPTLTAKPSATPTPSSSARATASGKPTATNSPAPTSSAKPSVTPTATTSPSVTPSAKPSSSSSPSATPSPTPSPTSSPAPIILPKVTVDPPPRSPLVDKAIAYALLQVGKPYVLGGSGPKNFDCSGLTKRAWAAAGISIARTSGQQFADTIHIAMTDALPGDLIFYGQNGSTHVAMYIGFGLIVEAANPRKGVVISPINTPWHNNNFGGIGRIKAPLSPVTQP